MSLQNYSTLSLFKLYKL